MKHFLPLSEPEFSGNEGKYLQQCLQSGWVSSQGPFVQRFERRIQGYLHRRFAVAVTSGTAALHLGLLAAGVGENDEVLVPALTFIAPVNAVRYCGGFPVFMDCDPETLGLDIDKILDFLARRCRRGSGGFLYNRRTGRRIKAIIPVHVFGHPVDLKTLWPIARRHRITVIEDATESLGSEYYGKKVGALGDIACLSFNGNKIITTGGGGMLVTDHSRTARLVQHLSTQAKKDAQTYFHDQIGYNYRLSGLQAACGVAQLERLNDFVQIKRRNAALYREVLKPIGVELLSEKPWAKSNYWLHTIRIPSRHRLGLWRELLRRGIGARPLWRLIPTLPPYREFEVHSLDVARRSYETCLNIPSSVGLKPEDIQRVAHTIGRYFGGSL